MTLIKFWFNNSRPHALPQSILPALTAVSLASASDNFSWVLSVLAVLGVMMAHLSMNLFDDYFDYKKKKQTYREELVHEGFRARISKCSYLASGQATLRQLLVACIVFGAIAVAFGAVIFYFRGINIVIIAGITAFLGIQYSAPPLRLSYHGLGEILIGVIFGLLNMLGTYYAACAEFSDKIYLLSVPVGLLVLNIVYVHSILDFIPDKKVGKSTLAVLLNNQKAMLFVLFFVLFIPYACILAGCFMKVLSAYYLLVFITLPMAISLFDLMLAFVRTPEKKFTPKIWYGPMSNWQVYCEKQIDWFLIRWFLARNLLSFFCLIILIVSFII